MRPGFPMTRLVAACAVLVAIADHAHATRKFSDLSTDEMRKAFEDANLADDCYVDDVEARKGYTPSGSFLNSQNVSVISKTKSGNAIFSFNNYTQSEGSSPYGYYYNAKNGMITPLTGDAAKAAGCDPNPPNFAAQVLEKDGTSHIALRGSGASLDDWVDTNTGQMIGKLPAQFVMADSLVQSVQDTKPGHVRLTAHSEGAGELQFATLESVSRGNTDISGSAFNYQQLSKGVKNMFPKEVQDEAGKRINYFRMGNDVVSGAPVIGDGSLSEEIHIGDASWKGDAIGIIDPNSAGQAHRITTVIDHIAGAIGDKIKNERKSGASKSDGDGEQKNADGDQKKGGEDGGKKAGEVDSRKSGEGDKGDADGDSKKAEDEQKKTEDDQKKAEDDQKKLGEDDAKKNAEDESKKSGDGDGKKIGEDDSKRVGDSDSKKAGEAGGTKAGGNKSGRGRKGPASGDPSPDNPDTDQDQENENNQDSDSGQGNSRDNDSGQGGGEGGTGKNSDLGRSEPVSGDPTGEGSQIPQGPVGPSLPGFLEKWLTDQGQKFLENNNLNQHTWKEYEQAMKNAIAEQTAQQTVNQGGETAQQLSTDSANTTANAQSENSWGKHLSDAVQQNISAGLNAAGTGFAGKMGDHVADELVKGIEGKHHGSGGKPGDSGGSGDSGDSGTAGESGTSGDSGTPGESGASGNSGDSGSGDSGTSGGSGDLDTDFDNPDDSDLFGPQSSGGGHHGGSNVTKSGSKKNKGNKGSKKNAKKSGKKKKKDSTTSSDPHGSKKCIRCGKIKDSLEWDKDKVGWVCYDCLGRNVHGGEKKNDNASTQKDEEQHGPRHKGCGGHVYEDGDDGNYWVYWKCEKCGHRDHHGDWIE